MLYGITNSALRLAIPAIREIKCVQNNRSGSVTCLGGELRDVIVQFSKWKFCELIILLNVRGIPCLAPLKKLRLYCLMRKICLI